VTALLVALAGGLGAAVRFLADSWIARHNRTVFPLGTITVNVTGSLLLGLLAGWLLRGDSTLATQALGVGFLGGYTTFSTASVEGVRLFRVGRRRDAALHAGGNLVLAVSAAALGVWLMSP